MSRVMQVRKKKYRNIMTYLLCGRLTSNFLEVFAIALSTLHYVPNISAVYLLELATKVHVGFVGRGLS